jgi:hypothetical protein
MRTFSQWSIGPSEVVFTNFFLLFAGCGGAPEIAHPRSVIVPIAVESRAAMAICRSLPGYERLHNSFEIEEALLGSVNSMPESLFVRLRSTKPRTIDAAWWWNPLSDKKPSLTWHDFQTALAEAERAVAKHPWLAELKTLPGERSLELHLLGMRVGKAEGDLDTFVLPAWRHAGMAGRPAYCLLARRGAHSWIEFLLSDEDDRAFVLSTQISDPAPHGELDRLDVHWHPRGKRGEASSKYAIVDREGRMHLQTFIADER